MVRREGGRSVMLRLSVKSPSNRRVTPCVCEMCVCARVRVEECVYVFFCHLHTTASHVSFEVDSAVSQPCFLPFKNWG